jgi:hypothetical protein
MDEFLKRRKVRIVLKAILLFALTLLYMLLLGMLFTGAVGLPKIVPFIFVSLWFIVMIFLIEYYL